jgi:hypothetical protein
VESARPATATSHSFFMVALRPFCCEAERNDNGIPGCGPSAIRKIQNGPQGSKAPRHLVARRSRDREAIASPRHRDTAPAKPHERFWRPPSKISLEPAYANASAPYPAPSESPARLADSCPSDADTTNSCPTRPASKGDLPDYAVLLMDGRGRHCLRRCCNG